MPIAVLRTIGDDLTSTGQCYLLTVAMLRGSSGLARQARRGLADVARAPTIRSSSARNAVLAAGMSASVLAYLSVRLALGVCA